MFFSYSFRAIFYLKDDNKQKLKNTKQKQWLVNENFKPLEALCCSHGPAVCWFGLCVRLHRSQHLSLGFSSTFGSFYCSLGGGGKAKSKRIQTPEARLFLSLLLYSYIVIVAFECHGKCFLLFLFFFCDPQYNVDLGYEECIDELNRRDRDVPLPNAPAA